MNKQSTFIIEHLEPKLYPWCITEYKNISKIVGKKNLWFTNLAKMKNKNALKNYGKTIDSSVKTLNLQNSCILDPEASSTLNPQNSKLCEYFIFGGILGDYPPRKRTKEELAPFLPQAKAYNIGKEQMSTDNAVLVVRDIIQGIPISKMQFQDGINIQKNSIESIQLPYRYRLINKKPFISRSIVSYLKNKKDF